MMRRVPTRMSMSTYLHSIGVIRYMYKHPLMDRSGSLLCVVCAGPRKRWPKARDAFLRSIHCKPTAEAWSGVGYAAYQSQELMLELTVLPLAVYGSRGLTGEL